jgi:predicted ATP-grasp superfamily ATP-dependent carboligase
MRKGWVGKRFIDLVDELEERAELATKKLEELNEQIQKDMDFSRIILN